MIGQFFLSKDHINTNNKMNTHVVLCLLNHILDLSPPNLKKIIKRK